MPEAASEEGRRSFLGPTIRRSFRSGRMVLVVGVVWSVILGVAIAVGAAAIRLQLSPDLPVFGSVSAVGALTVFTSDRTTGVLEYLVAYGVSPRRLFTNFIVAALASISIVLVIARGASVGDHLALGNKVSTSLLLFLGGYAIPMSYVSGAFATTVGLLVGAFLAARGHEQPHRVGPLPWHSSARGNTGSHRNLWGDGRDTTNGFLLVAGGALTLVALTVLYLLANIGHLLRRERLLSNA